MDTYWTTIEWDSDFFGFAVAKITRFDFNSDQLTAALRELKGLKYRLIYWSIPAGNQSLIRMARSLGGFLADEKVTYVRDLSTPPPAIPPDGSLAIVPYAGEEPDPTLLDLALMSGEYSRFRRDPLFPAGLFEKLYTCWITRSVRKEIAWRVLVARDDHATLGMVTLGESGGRGAVGLLAVAPAARGRRTGRRLLAAAESSFSTKGYTWSQVVTQRANLPAGRLYESCGYRVDATACVLHFWL